jgi:hypothetical protein
MRSGIVVFGLSVVCSAELLRWRQVQPLESVRAAFENGIHPLSVLNNQESRFQERPQAVHLSEPQQI